MARPLNKLEIQKRVKINSAIMKISKRLVLDSVSVNSKRHVSPPLAREALSNFIKAEKSFNEDTLKLKLLEDNK